MGSIRTNKKNNLSIYFYMQKKYFSINNKLQGLITKKKKLQISYYYWIPNFKKL